MKVTPVKKVNNDWNPDVTRHSREGGNLDPRIKSEDDKLVKEGPAATVEISGEARKVFANRERIEKSSTEGE